MTNKDKNQNVPDGFYWKDMTQEEKLDTAKGIAAHVAAGGILGLVELAGFYAKLIAVAVVLFLIWVAITIGLFVFS